MDNETNATQSIECFSVTESLANSVSIERYNGGEATASHIPHDTEEDKQNPTPVDGLAGMSRQPEITPADEGSGKLVRRDDGRYYFEPTVIIGRDDRVRVGNPTARPWRVHGHLIIRFPNGRTYIGSGTMVNRHHVLTAGHCMYSRADGGWATSVQFNPAQNDGNLPFGSAFAQRLISVTNWTERSELDWDFGMLILDQQMGDRTGYFGVITFGADDSLNRHRVNVSGYPGDKGGRQMWTHADVIKAVGRERFLYDVDTMGGQSGSGVWSTWQGHVGEKVAGIHTTGSLSGNGATRISRVKFDRIVEWMRTW
jgi:glutamyl endopeptidase